MTDAIKVPTPAQFKAACAAAGIALDARHQRAVLDTAQWLAAGLAKLREAYPDADQRQP